MLGGLEASRATRVYAVLGAELRILCMLNKHSTHRATIPDDGNRELTPTSYLLTSMQLNIRKHLQTELNGCPFRKSEEVTSSVGVGNK